MTNAEAAKLLDIVKVFDAPKLTEAIKLAKAALREQKDHIREVTKMVGWISVENRLPEYKKRVLFVDVRGLVFLAIDSVDWDDGRVSFLEPASGLWVQGSHWMPLPEPPKEDSPHDE